MRNKLEKTIHIFFLLCLMLLFILSINGCSEDKEWKEISEKAKLVKAFDSIDSVINRIGVSPTTMDERKMSVLDDTGDIITILVWDYGHNKKIYIKFYNNLAAELKIGEYFIFMESLNDADRNTKFNKK